MTTYNEAASVGFKVLDKQYRTSEIFNGNFWFGGNTLHTCLNYLLGAKPKQTDSTRILEWAYNNVYKVLDGPDWWRDDYSWWGNAFTLAINNRAALGYEGSNNDQLFSDLLTAAQYCWQKLQSNWNSTAYDSESDNSAGSANITGGTFNTHDVPPMSGRNSVTNEGFLLLSQGLASLSPQTPKYSQYANAESNWFAQWQEYPKNNGGKPGIFNAQGLVLERPTGNGTDPAWYWTGDQGLYMKAMSVASLTQAYEIAVAVTTHMVDKTSILHENMGFYQYEELKQFLADYATGKGIFMRSLAWINQKRVGQPFSDLIKKNASAVWANKLPGFQFTFNWNPLVRGYEPPILRINGKNDALCDLITQTAGLEALTAALSVTSPDEEMASTTDD